MNEQKIKERDRKWRRLCNSCIHEDIMMQAGYKDAVLCCGLDKNKPVDNFLNAKDRDIPECDCYEKFELEV